MIFSFAHLIFKRPLSTKKTHSYPQSNHLSPREVSSLHCTAQVLCTSCIVLLPQHCVFFILGKKSFQRDYWSTTGSSVPETSKWGFQITSCVFISCLERDIPFYRVLSAFSWFHVHINKLLKETLRMKFTYLPPPAMCLPNHFPHPLLLIFPIFLQTLAYTRHF